MLALVGREFDMHLQTAEVQDFVAATVKVISAAPTPAPTVEPAHSDVSVPRDELARAVNWIEAAKDGVLYRVAQDFDGVISANAEGLGQGAPAIIDSLRALLNGEQVREVPKQLAAVKVSLRMLESGRGVAKLEAWDLSQLKPGMNSLYAAPSPASQEQG